MPSSLDASRVGCSNVVESLFFSRANLSSIMVLLTESLRASIYSSKASSVILPFS